MSHQSFPLFLAAILIAIDTSFAQVTVNIFGASTPTVADGGDAQSIVLGVKMFSDVPGQILGCSFYKAAANTGIHVVNLWDSAGRLLATQIATSETTEGRQLILFSRPISIAANQVFTCGYFAPNGHFSNDKNTFASQKNVPPCTSPAMVACLCIADRQHSGRRVPGRRATIGSMCCSHQPPNRHPGSVEPRSAQPAARQTSVGIHRYHQIRKSNTVRPWPMAALLLWQRRWLPPTQLQSMVCRQEPQITSGYDAATQTQCWSLVSTTPWLWPRR